MTFCGEWMRSIRKALTTANARNGDLHYTANGMVTYFTDPTDGQVYCLTIEPVKSTASPQAERVAA